jgi:hypothetical protein
MKVIPLTVVLPRLMAMLSWNERKMVFGLVFFVGASEDGGKEVRRGWKVWCWSWTRGGFVWCLWKKRRNNYGYILLLFLKKLVHIIGLCFGLSSFSQWISPLFIKVERRVWGAYLAWIVTLNSNGKDINRWSKITITS